jgi:hypothetical protein
MVSGKIWGRGISVCFVAPLETSSYSPTTACNEISSQGGKNIILNDKSSNTNTTHGIQFKMCLNQNSSNSAF